MIKTFLAHTTIILVHMIEGAITNKILHPYIGTCDRVQTPAVTLWKKANMYGEVLSFTLWLSRPQGHCKVNLNKHRYHGRRSDILQRN